MSRMTDLANWVRANDNFTVVTHIHPDGDTLGSASALVFAFRGLGKKAFVCCQDDVPHMYRFIPGMGDVCTPEKAPFEPTSILFTDISTMERAGEKIQGFHSVTHTAVIDHHGTNPGYGSDVNMIDPDAAATGELVFELLEELGVTFTKEIAENLYMAIVCDTNNFSIPTVTGETYRKAGKLADTGIDIQTLCRKLIKMRTAQRTMLLGKALNRAQFACGGKIAYATLPRALFDEAGAGDEDTEGIVTILNDIENVQIAIFASELKDGRSKFSLRSAGECNVAVIASRFGGGGHDKAAGITISLPLDSAMEAVLGEAVKAVEAL